MTVYVHPNLAYTFRECPRSVNVVASIDAIPNGCDLVAWSFFEIYQTDLEHEILQLKKKTKHLLVEINEFVDVFLVDLEKRIHSQYPDITLTSGVVTNYPSSLIFSGCWMMQDVNYYDPRQGFAWAQEVLGKLAPPTASKPKKFDCLLGAPRDNRNFVEEKYQQCTLKDQIIYSYFKGDVRQGIWEYDLDDSIHSTACHLQMQDGSWTPLSNIVPTQIYNQTYCTIVAETVCENDFSLFTEKVVKPIVAKRLFVVFAGKNFLGNLKKLGFRTFDAVIDESYDQIDDSQKRWEAAWAEVEFLLHKENFDEISKATLDIVEHNYMHFISTDWNSELKKYINRVLM